MTIDSHFDEEGDLINHMNDSVWYVFTFSFQLSEARDHIQFQHGVLMTQSGERLRLIV